MTVSNLSSEFERTITFQLISLSDVIVICLPLILREHIAKLGIFENNGLTIGEQKNAIEKFYTLLLTEFRDMLEMMKNTRFMIYYYSLQ